ncbi:hypothetical protein DYBT9275_02769 [Dyadobacter sp. CECT 9275]|uniref:Fe2OG dioxygenase domain-containing protein n=1 Tax=Dyadobacter helix TaxID=2822344 RepID=A0A916JC80_9BACT|nr:2OG-Fe(II) oxygenase [Dyadobacter sp. CECT 9275]CAG5001928.1 hypothetical protein DYBT9275_02769 [Dyadobacter sp. CECT 9275]
MSISDELLIHKLFYIDNMISPETCMTMYLDMSENAVFQSSMVSDKRGDRNAATDTNYNDITHDGRISETAFAHTYTEKTRNALALIAKDVASILGVDTNQFEPWQCTRYRSGGLFDYHDDCGNWASNERLYTVMLTLRAPDFGGGTHFPRLNKEIPSKMARLLIWRNLDEDFLCDGTSMHAGMPVGKEGEEDEKMIVVTWVRRLKYVS